MPLVGAMFLDLHVDNAQETLRALYNTTLIGKILLPN